MEGWVKVVTDLCFSTASINTQRTRAAVKNISIKTPWTSEVPMPKVGVTAKDPASPECAGGYKMVSGSGLG